MGRLANALGWVVVAVTVALIVAALVGVYLILTSTVID